MFENKKFILIAVSAGIIIVALGYVLYRSYATPKSPAGSGNSANTVNIGTPAGNVKTRNFTLNPIKVVGSEMQLADTDEYQIIYYQQEQSFVILIQASPALTSRQHAEAAFLSNLQIDQASACKLNVSIKVPYSVDPKLAGPDYALSFCKH